MSQQAVATTPSQDNVAKKKTMSVRLLAPPEEDEIKPEDEGATAGEDEPKDDQEEGTKGDSEPQEDGQDQIGEHEQKEETDKELPGEGGEAIADKEGPDSTEVQPAEKELLGEGEEMVGEHAAEEAVVKKEQKQEEEQLVMEEQMPEEVDPAAPYEFSDEKEAMKAPFELTPEQIAEVESIWESFQNYTPAYTDIKDYVTKLELVYMLKSLQLQTFTPDQTQELIDFCVRPPNRDNFVYLEDFKRMVTIRTRDVPLEEAIRNALVTMVRDKSGTIEREFYREVITQQGFKMPTRMADNHIKEVDVANDGILVVDDILGTMMIDLNKEDMQMIREKVWGPTGKPPPPTPPKVEEEEEDEEEKPTPPAEETDDA